MEKSSFIFLSVPLNTFTEQEEHTLPCHPSCADISILADPKWADSEAEVMQIHLAGKGSASSSLKPVGGMDRDMWLQEAGEQAGTDGHLQHGLGLYFDLLLLLLLLRSRPNRPAESWLLPQLQPLGSPGDKELWSSVDSALDKGYY